MSFLKSTQKLAILSVIACGACVSAQAQSETLYLSDVATEAELTSDIFGVPMKIDNVGNSKYVARYYNAEANTPVYFLASKTSFADAYGLMDGELAYGSVAELDPIVLPEAGKYYEINLDTDNMEYSMTTYEPADYMDPMVFQQGSNNLNTWWSWADTGSDDWVHADDAWLQEFYIGAMVKSPEEIIRFNVDANNPHLYHLSQPIHYEAGESVNLAIHNWHSHGWWNYCSWRCDDDIECNEFMYFGGVVKQAYLDWVYGDQAPDWKTWSASEDERKKFVPDNWCHTPVVNSGDYTLDFDSHLGRAKLVPYVPAGVKNVNADDTEAPVEYYNIQGMRVNAASLAPGFYIRHQGSKAEKVLVK